MAFTIIAICIISSIGFAIAFYPGMKLKVSKPGFSVKEEKRGSK